MLIQSNDYLFLVQCLKVEIVKGRETNPTAIQMLSI